MQQNGVSIHSRVNCVWLQLQYQRGFAKEEYTQMNRRDSPISMIF